MSELIISVSGLRGIVGKSLTPEIAVRYAAAFAQGLPPGPIVLTRDGRATGPMLAQAVGSALTAMGRMVIDADVAATPTTGVLVRALAAAGGIQISASHNPAPYNGLKLFNAEGRVIAAAAGEAVKRAYLAGQFAWAPHDRVGQMQPCADPFGEHLRLLRAIVDGGRIRARRFRVLLDSNHGAGSLLGQRLLAELGCQTTLLGGQPNGQFSHPPEPTAENLGGVSAAVRDAGAVVGFCQDPDADRLAVIDERGRYLGEECTLALCLAHVLAQRQGPVVTNCATSRMAQDLASRHGCPFRMAPVGEANVVEAMLADHAVFGGEGNGGPIDPRVGYVRDSFVGMALLLDFMAASGRTIGELADALPRYEIHKAKIDLPAARLPQALAAIESHFAGAACNRMDGLRIDWPGRWLLIRGSNTEPIVRIIAETPTRETSVALCQEAAQVIAAC